MLRLSWGIATIVVVASCDDSVGASEARRLIEASEEVSALASRVVLHTGADLKGWQHGVWVPHDWSFIMATPTLTEAGATEFERVEGGPVTENVVYLRNPADGPEVQITGLTEPADFLGYRVSEATFTWRYRGLPEAAQRYAVRGGTGSAAFVQMNDGWKLDHVTLSYDYSDPYPLSDAARARADALAAELQAAREQAALAQQRVDSMRAEEERLAKVRRDSLIADSRIIRDTLAAMDHVGRPEAVGGRWLEQKHAMVVTDVSIEFTRISGFANETANRQVAWLVEVDAISSYELPYIDSRMRSRRAACLNLSIVPADRINYAETLCFGSAEDRTEAMHVICRAAAAWDLRYPGLRARPASRPPASRCTESSADQPGT